MVNKRKLLEYLEFLSESVTVCSFIAESENEGFAKNALYGVHKTAEELISLLEDGEFDFIPYPEPKVSFCICLGTGGNLETVQLVVGGITKESALLADNEAFSRVIRSLYTYLKDELLFLDKS
jgi:hypothetical protein